MRSIFLLIQRAWELLSNFDQILIFSSSLHHADRWFHFCVSSHALGVPAEYRLAADVIPQVQACGRVRRLTDSVYNDRQHIDSIHTKRWCSGGLRASYFLKRRKAGLRHCSCSVSLETNAPAPRCALDIVWLPSQTPVPSKSTANPLTPSKSRFILDSVCKQT